MNKLDLMDFSSFLMINHPGLTNNPGLANNPAQNVRKRIMSKTAVKQGKAASSPAPSGSGCVTVTLGSYAQTILTKHYERLVKQETGVLEDSDPEYLHQMRVATRRLRTALQVFGGAVHLSKAGREKQVQTLTRVLGQLRDLDVQIAALLTDYRPGLPETEQKWLDRAITKLQKQRDKTFVAVEQFLNSSTYHDLKAAYKTWCAQPSFTPIAELPLHTVLPDLLSPLLSKLLLHPGWLIAAAQSNQEGIGLHELRKTCKQARYQAEFFVDWYPSAFRTWVDELKQIQSDLGTVQDSHVLLEILAEKGSKPSNLPSLHQAIHQQQTDALKQWDEVRSKYVDQSFRHGLYQMILAPR